MTDSETYRDAMIALGRALYGKHWQRSLARDLGVSTSLINGLATGSIREFSPATISKFNDFAYIRQVVEFDSYKTKMDALNEALKTFRG